MKHFTDIQTQDMSRSEASRIIQEMVDASKDIDFVLTNVSYDIFRAVWNANVKHRKGVYVFGASGRGKTYAFMGIRRWQMKMRIPNPVMNVNVKTMEDMYKIEGAEYLKQLVSYPNVAFHNFGFQSNVIGDYGTKRNFMLDVLDQRYDFYQNDRSMRTHITSNFNKDFVESLGVVPARRIREMMTYYKV